MIGTRHRYCRIVGWRLEAKSGMRNIRFGISKTKWLLVDEETKVASHLAHIHLAFLTEILNIQLQQYYLRKLDAPKR